MKATIDLNLANQRLLNYEILSLPNEIANKQKLS